MMAMVKGLRGSFESEHSESDEVRILAETQDTTLWTEASLFFSSSLSISF